MKRGSTLILKAAIIFIGLLVLGLCVFIPAVAISDNTGDYSPILFGLYVPAIPFFIALYQALKLLGYIDKNQAFSEQSVDALGRIKYCGFIISGLFTAAMPYIFYVADKDDAPGVILMAGIIIGTSFVIGTAAAVFQSLLQNAVDIKSENDLTV